jgi:DNA-binding transcriptional ArsR family regulator
MLALEALADSHRRRIVEMLAEGELPSGEIAERFEISASAVSQHLKVLKDAQLVRVRVEAQRRIYELDPAGFSELDHWLRNIQQFWGIRLDALERRLREEAARARNKQRRRNKGKANER